MATLRRARFVLSLLLAACGPGAGAQTPIARFEARLEQLRTQSSIPAVTAVIAQGQRIVSGSAAATCPAHRGRGSSSTGS